MKDFSIDLETMGTMPYSALIAIGVQQFDRRSGNMGETFEITISPTDCVRQGLRMDPHTVMWWMGQSDEARAPFVAGGGATLHYALGALDGYLSKAGFDGSSCVWGNGSGFDINLLEDAYRAIDARIPWKFWQARDVRTAVDLMRLDKALYRHDGVHHNALDDARNQARMVIDATAAIRSAA